MDDLNRLQCALLLAGFKAIVTKAPVYLKRERGEYRFSKACGATSQTEMSFEVLPNGAIANTATSEALGNVKALLSANNP